MSRFRSLLQASVNATKKALTWNVEEWVPPAEKTIFKFRSKEDLKKWHLYSDSEYGGLSSASLEIPDGGNGSDGTGIFSGNLSVDLSEGAKWNISRSGFCGMRSKKFDGFIDLDGYDAIALRLRGDGRCYISTIYTENWVNSPGQSEDNSWQAFVFAPKDSWYTAKSNAISNRRIQSLLELIRTYVLRLLEERTRKKYLATQIFSLGGFTPEERCKRVWRRNCALQKKVTLVTCLVRQGFSDMINSSNCRILYISDSTL